MNSFVSTKTYTLPRKGRTGDTTIESRTKSQLNESALLALILWNRMIRPITAMIYAKSVPLNLWNRMIIPTTAMIHAKFVDMEGHYYSAMEMDVCQHFIWIVYNRKMLQSGNGSVQRVKIRKPQVRLETRAITRVRIYFFLCMLQVLWFYFV